MLDAVGENHLHPGAHELGIACSDELLLSLQPIVHIDIWMTQDLSLNPCSCLVAFAALSKLLEGACAIHDKAKQDSQIIVPPIEVNGAAETGAEKRFFALGL